MFKSYHRNQPAIVGKKNQYRFFQSLQKASAFTLCLIAINAPLQAGANKAQNRTDLIPSNIIKAETLLRSLYYPETGAQQDYAPAPDSDKASIRRDSGILTRYGRVWIYNQAIALLLESRRNSPKAHALADWLYWRSIYVPLSKNE